MARSIDLMTKSAIWCRSKSIDLMIGHVNLVSCRINLVGTCVSLLGASRGLVSKFVVYMVNIIGEFDLRTMEQERAILTTNDAEARQLLLELEVIIGKGVQICCLAWNHYRQTLLHKMV